MDWDDPEWQEPKMPGWFKVTWGCAALAGLTWCAICVCAVVLGIRALLKYLG